MAVDTEDPTRFEKFILITLDDLGIDRIGCYQNDPSLTPYINRIASEGSRFTQAYAGGFDDSMSRWSILTGMNPVLRLQTDPVLFHSYRMDFEILSRLKSRGFATAAIGLWAIGSGGNLLNPNHCGFQEWFGVIDSTNARLRRPPVLWRNTSTFPFPDQTPTGEIRHVNELYFRAALNFIEQNQDNPFFLYLAPSTYESNGVDDEFESLAETDRLVGVLLDKLDSLSLMDKTCIVLTSDSASEVRKVGPQPSLLASFIPGGLHVPLLLYAPGIESSKTVHARVTTWDILPTIAQWTGVEVSRTHDERGKGLDSVLRGSGQDLHEPLVWRMPSPPHAWVLFNGVFKGVYNEPEKSWEIFNLQNDSEERNPSTVRRFQSVVEDYLARLPFAPADP